MGGIGNGTSAIDHPCNGSDGFTFKVFPDGSRYEGQWKDGLKHGRGRFIYPDGDIYDGEWLEGKRMANALTCRASRGISVSGATTRSTARLSRST